MSEATLDVLEVLLSGDEGLYGLKIARATGRPTGSVFPILARLEETGWATSEWEEGDRATIRSPSSVTSSMISGDRPEKNLCTRSLTSFMRRSTTLITFRHHRK